MGNFGCSRIIQRDGQQCPHSYDKEPEEEGEEEWHSHLMRYVACDAVLVFYSVC